MNNKKKFLSLMLVLMLVLSLSVVFTACGDKDGATTTTPSTSESRSAVDMSGNTVTVTGEVKRIVNLWPAGTSSFYAMGAGEILVGQGTAASAWATHLYPNAANIPALGTTDANVESILALNPDLVIIHPSSQDKALHTSLIESGIPTANINFSDYETMIQAYTFLGKILGGKWQVKLNTWCNAVRADIAWVRSLTANLTPAEKPIVFYIAGQRNAPTTTMAANSIFEDWVTSAGGRYAMAEWQDAAGMNLEETYVLSKDIDVIICGGTWQHVIAQKVNADWTDLDAVQTNRVYKNPYCCFNWDRFGLESLMQMKYALYCIQPDIAAKAGITQDYLKNMVRSFYSTYADVTLTDEVIGYMLEGKLPDGTYEQAASSL